MMFVFSATFEGLLAPTRKTGAGGTFAVTYDAKARLATFKIQIDNLRQSGRGKRMYCGTSCQSNAHCYIPNKCFQ